jgi:hypothetical protein
MRRTLAVAPLALLLAVGGWTWAQTPADDDAVLRAMRDEVARSMKLSVPGLEAPYFVQYRLTDGDNLMVAATMGGVVTHRRTRYRIPEFQVRVGDYKFDNTNYAGFGFGSRYDIDRFPLEGDYAVLRRFFWLGTDSAYKSAVEGIARKRAALRNMTVSEQLNDFAKAEPIKMLRPLRPLAIDEDDWVRRVRALSAIFLDFPEIRFSSVDLEAGQGGLYLANSEGSEMRVAEGTTYLRARASAQARDGMLVRDAVVFHALDATRMALEPEMRRSISALAANVTALARAPRGEDYNGPVLFEGVAAAQLFAEVLGRNFALTRRPVVEPGRPAMSSPSELEGRQGARIVPEWISITDDPTQSEWRGRPLFGFYEADREGVPGQALRLVEKGVLKSFLMTRQPVRGYEGSNGHARLPGSYGAQAAGVSNLFVNAGETVSMGALRKQLLDTIRARNKPYGVIVRKMDFPSSASFDEARRLLSGQSGSSRPVSLPILVYKLYVDGREELVRGLRFRGLNARSFKDLMAAADDSNVFEYFDNSAPFALMDGSSYASESCVVAPSILIDDLELHPLQDELPKLPVAPPPAIVK